MPAARLLRTLRAWLRRKPKLPRELQAGREVIDAIDSGGLPLDPGRINRIARELGLDVAANAPVEQTIERLRAAVERGLQNLAMLDAANKHKGGRK
ncbi:MAG: hypothetical protein NDI67_11685 [Sulfuritalea sp.]|nr:hypothetical protein [Sulfuritalea sp.]